MDTFKYNGSVITEGIKRLQHLRAQSIPTKALIQTSCGIWEHIVKALRMNATANAEDPVLDLWDQIKAINLVPTTLDWAAMIVHDNEEVQVVITTCNLSRSHSTGFGL